MGLFIKRVDYTQFLKLDVVIKAFNRLYYARYGSTLLLTEVTTVDIWYKRRHACLKKVF